MNFRDYYYRARPWLKPALTTLMGLILILRPDTLTSAIGVTAGFLVALLGAGLLISFLFGHTRDGLRLAGAIILMVLGFSVIKSPLSLTSQLGRFVGILLVLQSVRELSGQFSLRSKAMSIVSGVVGLVLMLVPVTSSRLIISGCGVVVLLMGGGMLLERWKNPPKPVKEDIIDAE